MAQVTGEQPVVERVCGVELEQRGFCVLASGHVDGVLVDPSPRCDAVAAVAVACVLGAVRLSLPDEGVPPGSTVAVRDGAG